MTQSSPIKSSKTLTSNRWSGNFDKETDWNIVSEPNGTASNRQVKLSRGKFLGGCSGCNGTLIVRGSKQDYDDWGLEGWSGDEFFKCMNKVCPSGLTVPRISLTPEISRVGYLLVWLMQVHLDLLSLKFWCLTIHQYTNTRIG